MKTDRQPKQYFAVADDLDDVSTDLSDAINSANQLSDDLSTACSDAHELRHEIETVAALMGVNIELPEVNAFDGKQIKQLNIDVDEAFRQAQKEIHKSVPRLPRLTAQEFVVSGLCGVAAALVDAFLVGAPHKGNSSETGSPLTDLLRKIGQQDGDLHPLLKWFEKKCTVPYDKSSIKNMMYPKNHRLRSFAHDPLLGMLFAIIDLKLGTCTCIDNSGMIQMIPGAGPQEIEVLTCIVVYFGHLISDVCTKAGLPIPGWCLTQLLTGEGKAGISFAKVTQEMYIEGYDLRHLLSMKSSNALGCFLLWLYHKMQKDAFGDVTTPGYQREIEDMHERSKKDKMLFIMNSVATTGNLVKVLTSENITAINLPQWIAMVKSSATIVSAVSRDMSPELAVMNRNAINAVWGELELD